MCDVVWMSPAVAHFIICQTAFLSTHAAVAVSCPVQWLPLASGQAATEKANE